MVAGTSAAQGTGLGNFTATLGNIASSSEVGSAAKHRARAQELQGQIVDLSRKLERLSAAGVTLVPAGRSANGSAPLTAGARSLSGVDIVGSSKAPPDQRPGAWWTSGSLKAFQVMHLHGFGECNGWITIGKGRIKFDADYGKDSFDVPLRYLTDESIVGGDAYFRLEADRNYRFHLLHKRRGGVLIAAIKEAKGE